MDILDRLDKESDWYSDEHGLLHKQAADEIRRLRNAAQLAIRLIDVNLYHQREKVQDAALLLRQALDPI